MGNVRPAPVNDWQGKYGARGGLQAFLLERARGAAPAPATISRSAWYGYPVLRPSPTPSALRARSISTAGKTRLRGARPNPAARDRTRVLTTQRILAARPTPCPGPGQRRAGVRTRAAGRGAVAGVSRGVASVGGPAGEGARGPVHHESTVQPGAPPLRRWVLRLNDGRGGGSRRGIAPKNTGSESCLSKSASQAQAHQLLVSASESSIGSVLEHLQVRPAGATDFVFLCFQGGARVG